MDFKVLKYNSFAFVFNYLEVDEPYIIVTLKNNGKIFIDVPNLKEIIKLGGFGLFFHEHISYFSLETLRRLLNNNGFKVNKSFEGNPNLFVEAVKVSKNNVLALWDS